MSLPITPRGEGYADGWTIRVFTSSVGGDGLTIRKSTVPQLRSLGQAWFCL